MDLRMRLLVRVAGLSLALLLAYVLVVAASLGDDVADEMRASARLTDLILAADAAARQGDETSLAKVAELLEGPGLRHLRVRLDAVRGQPAMEWPAPETGAESWVERQVEIPPEIRRVRVLPLGAHTLTLAPDAGSEVNEILQDAGRTLAVLAVFCVATLLAVWWSAHRALSPVRALEGGLARMAEGRDEGGMPRFELREFDRIARAIDALSAELAQARAAQTRLTRRLLDVQEDERRELARELHDDLGQSLTAIQASAAFIDRHVEDAQPGVLRECAGDIRTQAHAVQMLLRSMLARLRPYGLDALGIGGAIQDLVTRWGQRPGAPQVALRLPAAWPALEGAQSLALYRALQESLTNIQKHAPQATLVEVTVTVQGNSLRATVSDDGGARVEDVMRRQGSGLGGMRERLSMCGGSWRLADAPGGLRVEMALPLLDPRREALEFDGDPTHDPHRPRG